MDTHQIPYSDVSKFLTNNRINFKNEEDAYNQLKILLKTGIGKNYPVSILEWIIAHNILLNNINIPYYTSYEIDNMSEENINILAKKLTMKKNNRENIKHILEYLGKLYSLLPEITNIISNTLDELKIKEIDVVKLGYKDVIKILKENPTKKIFKKFIYDNLEKIIISNIHDWLQFQKFESVMECKDFLSTIKNSTNLYNNNIMLDIIEYYKKDLVIFLDDEKIENTIKKIKNNQDDGEVYIGKIDMNLLIDFTVDLIDINEIQLARKVFDIANELKLFGRSYSYNNTLVLESIFNNIDFLEIMLDFLGEEKYKYEFQEIIDSAQVVFPIDVFDELIENLIILGKHDLANFIQEIQ